jgi:hypothetical protein
MRFHYLEIVTRHRCRRFVQAFLPAPLFTPLAPYITK